MGKIPVPYFDCLVYSGIYPHMLCIQSVTEEDNNQQME